MLAAAVLARGLGLRPLLAESALARDKHLMRRALNAGEEFPRSFLLRDTKDIEAIPPDVFPCVLKPRFGFNSRSVCIVKTRDELRRVFAEQSRRYRQMVRQDGTNGDFVVEDMLKGAEHTIDSLVKDGRVLFHLISDKRTMIPPFFIEVGDLMPGRVSDLQRQEIEACVARAIACVGVINGWTHTEVKMHEDRPVAIEVAARMGGGYFEQLIEEVYGIDRMRVLLDLHLERPLPEKPAARCTIAARRVVTYGIERIVSRFNPGAVFGANGVRLIWPESPAAINRLVVGPPHDFNNTVFEFFARGASPAEAIALADATERKAALCRIRIPEVIYRAWSWINS